MARVTAGLEFADAFLLLSKSLWRQGYVRCPGACASDVPQEACACSCPLNKSHGGRRARRHWCPCSQPHRQSRRPPRANGLSDDDLLDELCHDPTLWPVHGNGERFLQYLRILDSRGDVDLDETWGYAHRKAVPSDAGIVCDWSRVGGGGGGSVMILANSSISRHAPPAPALAIAPLTFSIFFNKIRTH
ncbi:hypothetical protein CTAYLR_005042, partial [Chrysophaeum taylorii]